MGRADLLLQALAQDRHASLPLPFLVELSHMATPTAREARKRNEDGLQQPSGEELAKPAAVPKSFSALSSCNVMVNPGRKC